MKIKVIFLVIAAQLMLTGIALGQAMPTATRRGAIQLGGTYVGDFPDYTNSKFYGYGVYADFDYAEKFGVEFNYRDAIDQTSQLGGGGHVPAQQRSFEVGERYNRIYGRVVPYARVSFGYAQMQYPPLATPPASQSVSAGTLGYFMYSIGGGVDYTVTSRLSIRADFEAQTWLSRTNTPSPNNINGLPRGLTPFVYSGGVAYRFGYGNLVPIWK